MCVSVCRALCEWCSMTAGCSTRSTSSWRAGSGIVRATASSTSVTRIRTQICPFISRSIFNLNRNLIGSTFLRLTACLCWTDIPMSVGIVEPKTHPSQLNAAEFLWDMKKRTSVFVQVTRTHTQTETHNRLFVPPVGGATLNAALS